MLDLLSFKHFDYYLDIKRAYNEVYKNTTLLNDIKKYKNIFKLFLIGLFHDTLEFKCYLIHKALKKNKIDQLYIVYECDHNEALLINKTYLSMYGKEIKQDINLLKSDDNSIKYLYQLLSDYFLPKPKKKDIKNIVGQLMKMNKNNIVHTEIIFYFFQLPDEITSEIIETYEKLSNDDIFNFIERYFEDDIRQILTKRAISLKKDNFELLLSKFNEILKNKNEFEFIKNIILNRYNFFNIKSEYIKKYGDMDLTFLSKEILIGFKNIYEFNLHSECLLIGDLINDMKIGYSLPFIYILNIDKISFRK